MAKSLRNVSLNDKFDLDQGVAYMSGLQALARIPIAQRRRDIAAGLNTAGFISGYRGSPLGTLDQALERAGKQLEGLNVKFLPGVNEDMAATAIWGTQQVGLLPGSKVDGVFGIWYGKSPGVDRSGDVMRHANALGTAPKGGVLAIVGDDHACKSSTLPCQSDHALYALMIPMLYPASIQEFVEYGVLGIEMSRYSGCWVALKVTSETVETSGTVDLSRERRTIENPGETEFRMPPDGLHIRLNDVPREVDARLQNYKLFACHAFARKNNIDRVVIDSTHPRFGIITSGKSYADVRQALIELGITEDISEKIGLRLYKVGMPWPLEPVKARAFVEGLEEILIIEEKREFIESQLKQQIFNSPAGKRPVVIGKYDEDGNVLLPLENDHSVGLVARVIARRIARFYKSEKIDAALKFHEACEKQTEGYAPPSLRQPYYCSGCPHNTSTKVPEDSFAMVGIGCHYMVQWMDRNSAMCTQMGGEGVPWVGMAPFSETKHIFANLGDGTYFHSGILAIRQAAAANVNITYKILYNDAVAMTGGQHVDGDLSVHLLAQQVAAEGVKKCWIVTENPEHYADRKSLPVDVPVLHRRWLNKVMLEAREIPGCTVIIYDQTCAAEKRRRRKRGQYPDPARRVFINKDVCEGCGDCSTQSNCVSITPVETEYGRKRMINQSTCNKDYSCLKGFCPSFVTVEGGTVRKSQSGDVGDLFATIPEPKIPPLDRPYNVMVTGIGGTGVLTVGALLGMAAHLEGDFCAVLDMTGLAQKNGEVLSHVRLGPKLDELQSGHIIAGGTDLLLACDIVSAVGRGAFKTLSPVRTKAVVNTYNMPVAGFVLDGKMDFHDEQIRQTLLKATNPAHQHFIEATTYAGLLLGDEIATNIFMMGYAWQKGLVPLSRAALERAIEINGTAIEQNKKAFHFGRLAAHDLEKLKAVLPATVEKEKIATTLEEIIEKRMAFLSVYQNKAYARRYRNLVERIKEAEVLISAGAALTEAAARNYHKLLAYKDEYEVARLYTNGDYIGALRKQFDGDYTLHFHMAPPLFEKTDPATGRPMKRSFGPWMMGALYVLAKFRFLRGTPIDPFAYSKDRREERVLIAEYEALVDAVLSSVSKENMVACVELLSTPDDIRGYGPVKAENIRKARQKQKELLAGLSPSRQKAAA